jgi:hypothetical protein
MQWNKELFFCFFCLTFLSAIMDYHSHKMEEINKTIKELWVSTYVGAGKLMG